MLSEMNFEHSVALSGLAGALVSFQLKTSEEDHIHV